MQINRDYETTDACYPYNNPAWIVIHYTAGADGVTARDNAIYFKREGAARGVGTHYFLGDDGIFASTPEMFGAWTNGNWEAGHSSITIEVACGTDEPSFTETEIGLLAELVQDIMKRYGIEKDHVIRHYDIADYFGGDTVDPHKPCPRQYVDDEKWEALRDRITGGANEESEEDMVCIFQPNGASEMIYYDGVNLHKLDNPDEMEAIKMVYRQCNPGKEIPIFKLGSKNAPWASRFCDAVRHSAPNYTLH